MAYLEISRVTFTYPRKTKPALREVDLAMEKEELLAVVGPNGSGKTTLTKLIIGVLKAASGEIRLAGRPVGQYSLGEIGRRIGYVFQNPDLQFFCGSVAEEIGFGLTNRGYAREEAHRKIDFYLDYFELADCRSAFPLHLSRGEKQRVAIAAVLAGEPEFLIMDEPTSGLDACRKKLLADYLRKIARLDRGMVLVSHDTAFVSRVAERVVTMAEGRITSDQQLEGK